MAGLVVLQMPGVCGDPIASASHGLSRIEFTCGASWEVDLRADPDCNRPGLERCHPRYTLGWRNREVKLHRDGLSPPKGTEYLHAFCDVWRQGRTERVLAAPSERNAVKERAARHAEDNYGEGQHPPNVLILVVRGLSLAQSRTSLPLTSRLMTRLRRQSGGRLQGAGFRKFVPASASGASSLQALVHGTAERPLPAWASQRSLWRAYERWGYVTAFGEAGCVTDASAAAGISLDGKGSPADHVLVEPACALDTQLRSRSQSHRATTDLLFLLHNQSRRRATGQRYQPSLANAAGAYDASATGGNGVVGSSAADSGAAGLDACEGSSARAVIKPTLEYMEAFLQPKLYEALPKMAMVVLPAAWAGPDARALDRGLVRLISATFRDTPNTVLIMTSDVPLPPATEPYDAPPSDWASLRHPLLRILLPTLQAAPHATSSTGVTTPDASTSLKSPPVRATAGEALVANAALPASTVDLHATLLQLPMLPLVPLLRNRTLPPTCAQQLPAHRPSLLNQSGSPPAGARQGVAVGGCSLLTPLPADRACSATLAPRVFCLPALSLRAARLARAPQLAISGAHRLAATSSAGTPSESARQLTGPGALSGSAPFVTARQDGSPPPPGGSPQAALRRLRCALRAARRRVGAPSRALAQQPPTTASVARRTVASATHSSSCAVEVSDSDAALLKTIGAESDMFACDAPRFASLRKSVLHLECPPERMPMYQIGLHPKLHAYYGPTRMPNGTEYVAAYCRHADAQTSACERVGREHKPSNHAAIRRQCPALSHGWVLDAAVENRRLRPVAQRARRRRRQWLRQRAAADTGAGLQLNVLLLMLDSLSAARFAHGLPITRALLESWSSPTGGRPADHTPSIVASARASASVSGTGATKSAQQDGAAPARAAGAGSAPPRHPSSARELSRRARLDTASNASSGGTDSGWRSFRFDLFTVVGSNSPRNQFPMLSGLTSLEWARDHGGRGHECIVPGFDDGVRASADHTCEQWIFEDYRRAGYVTNFGTNMCDWGVMEEVYPFDTKHPPTDHHLMEPWCHVDYDVDKLYFRPMSRCLGGRPAHAPLMQYELDFLRSYAPLPRLSWSVFLEGHEPSFRSMASLDADLAAHLLRLRATHGERTAIFLVSDHGIHYGKYYDGARAGHAEHSLPVFYALFPRSTLAAHPDIEAALAVNRRRLVSAFDIHATLLHLLSYPSKPALPDWSAFPARMQPRSLLTRIPLARTCDEAGIPNDACPGSWDSGGRWRPGAAGDAFTCHRPRSA